MRDIDAVIEHLKLAYPGISAEQLTVLHPGADDDGLWFFSHTASTAEIQLESPLGSVPFLVESAESPDREVADTVQKAVGLIVAGLGLTGPTA